MALTRDAVPAISVGLERQGGSALDSRGLALLASLPGNSRPGDPCNNVPLQRSTGGKQKLGRTSKMGERTLRRLLIIGASSVVQQATRRGALAGSWLAQMLLHKPGAAEVGCASTILKQVFPT